MKPIISGVFLFAAAQLSNATHHDNSNPVVTSLAPQNADSHHDATSRARKACQLTRHLLTRTNYGIVPEYIDPASALYAGRVEVKWSDNCWQDASCIVAPSTADEVSKVLEIISSTKTTFAVRGGGHDFNVNHSDVGNSGILLDMANFKSISLSPDKKTVTAGAGSLWGEVYKVLKGQGVSVNGARSPDPGIVGQTIGGGFGWFNSLAGVTAASLIGAEVVLANGSIVHADQKSHGDLLWALRGGGPNFGIVTSLTYKTLPIDKLWFEARLYASDKNQQLLDALIQYDKLAKNDPKAAIVVSLSGEASTPGSFVGFTYLAPQEHPPVFSPFYNITPTSSITNSTIGTLSDLAESNHSPQFPAPGVNASRHYVVSISHKIDQATYRDTYKVFTAVAKEASKSKIELDWGSQPIYQSAVRASLNTPLGLTVTDQDWIHVTVRWSNASQDHIAKKFVQDVGHKIETAIAAHGTGLGYRFLNDAYDGQRVLSSYGPTNFRQLEKVSRAYDPERLFQRQQNGGWLLSREQGAK